MTNALSLHFYCNVIFYKNKISRPASRTCKSHVTVSVLNYKYKIQMPVEVYPKFRPVFFYMKIKYSENQGEAVTCC